MASATAFAQPANDTCAGAVVIPASTPMAYTSPLVDDTNATSTGDPTTCASMERGLWWTFTPSVSGVYRINTCGTGGTLADTIGAVYTSAGGCAGPFVGVPQLDTTTVCDDDSCNNPTTQRSIVNVNLTAGTTYYIVMGGYAYTPAQTGTFAVSVIGAPANDVCTAAAPLPLNQVTTGTIAAANANNNLDGGSGFFTGVGHISSTSVVGVGRDVVYQFTAPTAGAYTFRLSPISSSVAPLAGGFANGMLYIADDQSCSGSSVPANVLGASNRHTSTTTPEEISCLGLSSSQQVYVFVDDNKTSTSSNNPGGDFELEVVPCFSEGTAVNNDPATAVPLECGSMGQIETAGDVDFFSLGTPPDNSRLFSIVDGYPSNSALFDLRVTNATEALEYDNDDNDTDFGASAPNLAGSPLSSVPMYLRVNNNSTTTTVIAPYRIYTVIQDGGTVNEIEPNDTPAAASGGPGNYFYGAMAQNPDGGPGSVDIDYYVFEGRAGQVLMLNLDSDPLRSNTPFNGQLALLDSNGVVLRSVTDTSATNAGSVIVGSMDGGLDTPAEALWYRIRTDGFYYARVTPGSATAASGTGDYILSVSFNCSPGGGLTPPGSALSFTPGSGSSLGGTIMTVNGTGFLPVARVRVGGNYSPLTTFVSSSQLTAVTPAGTPGPATVEVVHPGNQAVAAPGTFLYLAPPTISSVTPDAGTTLGGTPFVIAGTDFIGTTFAVNFGTAPVASFTVDSPTQISGITAPHAAGTVSVTVTTDYGSFTKTNAFTFIEPPVLMNVAPPSGPTSGGNTVTLNGSGFTAATEIKVDGVVVPQNTSGTANAISFTAPAHAAGAVSIQVTNPDGQTQTVNAAYTYIAPPDVTSILPTQGATTGNEVVTITGSNFDSTATVTFDADPGTNVTVTGGTTITVTTPGHAAGTVTVTVRNADGQTDTVSFEYVAALPPPVVTSIAPTSGTTYGGTVVTIAGSDFIDGGSVTFDGLNATNVTVDSPTQITATTPAHVFGFVDVSVVNPDNQLSTLDAGFEYIAPPPTLAAAAIAPASGRTTTTTNITITGDEFLPGVTVTIGGNACGNLVRVSKTTLTCTAPAHAAGFVAVVVSNPDGKSVTQNNAFEYIPAPTVVGPVTPNSGPTAGGTTVVITGTGFRSGANVKFGTVTATFVSVDSATQITATAPAQAAGTVSITVTNPDNQAATLANAFTYYAPPGVTGITPNQGYAVGGTNVFITGTAFRAGATVSFIVGGNAVSATNVNVASATSITATTPAQTPGLADVKVTNVDGQTFTLPAAFRFVPAPTVSAVAPDHGAAVGGTRITLTGTGFLAGATVDLGGAPGTGVAINSAGTQLSATTTAHPAGQVSILITNPDGQKVTLTNSFTFDEAPALSAVDPNVGPTAGGNTVTLTGTGFQQGAAVIFGTSSATVTNVTATTITVTAPARPAGVVLVRVTNPDGQSSQLINAYRYVVPPTVTAITPGTGPDTGGTRVTLTGTGFVAGTTVSFGGLAATDIVALSATSLEANTPAHAAGAVDVAVTVPTGGTSTLTNGFTYEATAPTLAQIAPTTGTTEGGTVLTLTGSGFRTGATVKLGGVDATNVAVVSSTLIRATTPPHAAGVVDVDVFNSDGLSARLSSAYTYVAPSSPTEGRVTDGGTGGVTDTTGGDTDVIRPAPACGCNAGSLNAMALLALSALFAVRRRKV